MLSSFHKIIISTSLAATASFVLSPLCCRLAWAVGAVDRPTGSRRMHSRPTPRLGGIAVFSAFFLALSLWRSELSLILLTGGSLILALGITDDVLRLSPMKKLAAQSVAAVTVIVAGADILTPEGASPLYFFLELFWILLVTNAFNLIDGLDGLCSGVGAVSSFLLFLASGEPSTLILSAALVGFLPHNLHPAASFLGDTGALTVGFVLSVLSLSLLPALSPLRGSILLFSVFFVPLFDTVLSFFRRTVSGRSPFSPDRGHLHHRLADAGLSQPAASLLIVTASSATGALGVMLVSEGITLTAAVCLILSLISFGCILCLARRRESTYQPPRRQIYYK